MRALIVEDEIKTLKYLTKGLCENGFLIDGVGRPDEAIGLLQSKDYDLIILDVNLPGKDGFSLLSDIRQSGKQIPVLFLTARDAVDDRVKGLKLGADDYLIKPFAFSELLARIETILRRGKSAPQLEKIKIADLEIDILNHRVFRDGKRIELTQKEFLLLGVLARHPGRIFSRTILAEQVWDMNFDSDTNVVDVAVRRLRSKIDDPFQMQLIHTVRGMGYVLEKR